METEQESIETESKRHLQCKCPKDFHKDMDNLEETIFEVVAICS